MYLLHLLIALRIPLALAQSPPATAPPPGTLPPPGAPPPAGSVPPPMAAPRPGGNGITFQLVETDAEAPLQMPIVTVAIGSAEAMPFPLADDGHAGGDPVAGDGHWATNVNAPLGQPLTLAVFSGTVSGKPLLSVEVTVPEGTKNPEVRVIHDAAGVHLDVGGALGSKPGARSPPKPGAPPPGGAPGGMPGGGAPGATMPSAPAGASAAGASRTSVAAAAGATLLALGIGGVVGWTLGRRGKVLAPLGRRESLRFGMSAGQATALVVPEGEGLTLLIAAVGALQPTGSVLVLPRPESRARLADCPFPGAWQFPKERPDGIDALRCGLRSGFSALVVEGPGALEAPVSGEPAGIVMDELVAHGKLPLLLILREGEAIPLKARVIHLHREGGVLAGGDIRLDVGGA